MRLKSIYNQTNYNSYIRALHEITLLILTYVEVKSDDISAVIREAAHICVNCAHREYSAL
jgi:hypothetical protein